MFGLHKKFAPTEKREDKQSKISFRWEWIAPTMGRHPQTLAVTMHHTMLLPELFTGSLCEGEEGGGEAPFRAQHWHVAEMAGDVRGW